MNTPAHAALNLLVLGRAERHALPVAIGAVAPDLPMLAFYGWERGVRRVSESVVWSERYYDSAWQVVFDIPHSIPIVFLVVAGLALLSRRWESAASSRRRGFTAVYLFLSSMALHALVDLPLHREDAHRHFFPFSDWRFVSPVSYWDPDHFGIYAGSAEVLLVIGVCTFLFRRYRGVGRWVIGALSALYLVFVVFAVVAWSGLTG